MAWYDIFNFNKPQPEKANIRRTIDFEQQLQRVRQDATKYNIALTAAESPMYPNRFLLMQLYQQIVLDGQIQSAMLQRKSKILSKPLCVYGPDGEKDEIKSAWFESKWFNDFANLALDSKFWGFSLVQFGPIINDQYTSVELVPRIYVVPEFSLVRSNTATVTVGKRFDESPYNNWAIGVGDKKDLGLFMYLAPYVIWKKNAMAAWAEFAEVFGSPIRIGKTDVRDELTRKNMENMLKNMGVASWAVLDLNDNIEMMQASRTDAYQVFDKMVERCNSEISKIILGQTGTTDEKAYSGSANVHENVMQLIEKQDKLWMQHVINNQLIPMMIRNGFDLGGCYARFNDSESLPLAEQAKIDVSFLQAGIKLEHEYLEHKYGVEIADTMPEADEQEEVIEIENRLRNLYK
jgi:hypothetical protein